MTSWIDKFHEKFAANAIGSNDQIPDVSEWKAFLGSLKECQDPIDVAYNKYLCRMHLFSKPKRLFMNLLGLGATVVELVYLLKSNRSLKPKQEGVAVLEKSRAVPNFDDVVPDQIYADYETVVVSENFNNKFGTLCKEAKKLFWQCVKRHPFSFFFNYFVYVELAAHSHFLLEYNPEATVVYVNERNVASAIITQLYEQGGRKFISFMHGEYLLQLIQGYMCFSQYYVWDDHYVDMFQNDLNCQIKEYRVYTPKKLQKKWDFTGIEPAYFCTYYFSGESLQTVLRLAEILSQLQAKGLKCKVRPHPRDVVHLQDILRTFQGIEIEDSRTVSLHDSFAQTEYVVGLISTVMSEAVAEGKKIVVDDMSDPEQFASLSARKAVVLTKEHILLSELCAMKDI